MPDVNSGLTLSAVCGKHMAARYFRLILLHISYRIDAEFGKGVKCHLLCGVIIWHPHRSGQPGSRNMRHCGGWVHGRTVATAA